MPAQFHVTHSTISTRQSVIVVKVIEMTGSLDDDSITALDYLQQQEELQHEAAEVLPVCLLGF